MNSPTIPQDDATESRRLLQELVDRNEITDLVSRLGVWLDDKQFDDAPSILTEDASARTPGGSVEGLDLIVEQARRNHDVARTQHVITNVLIDLDGDRATVRANLIVTMVDRAEAPGYHFDIGERYDFEAARTPQGWRLTRVQSSPVWTTGSRNGRPV
jgi:3-phenylpropionate/cinnamic acid dioxygenase small subunit